MADAGLNSRTGAARLCGCGLRPSRALLQLCEALRWAPLCDTDTKRSPVEPVAAARRGRTAPVLDRRVQEGKGRLSVSMPAARAKDGKKAGLEVWLPCPAQHCKRGAGQFVLPLLY